jgi:hypothetical protein
VGQRAGAIEYGRGPQGLAVGVTLQEEAREVGLFSGPGTIFSQVFCAIKPLGRRFVPVHKCNFAQTAERIAKIKLSITAKGA